MTRSGAGFVGTGCLAGSTGACPTGEGTRGDGVAAGRAAFAARVCGRSALAALAVGVELGDAAAVVEGDGAAVAVAATGSVVTAPESLWLM